MYRLLIVDNERIIVDSLVDLFEKEKSLPIEVIGTYSSAEALAVLESMKIDIVLSDIRMPGMDGLTLHKRIIHQWPWCKVIFLTGYDDFEYIKHAIRHNSVDYLLKTEGDEAILHAVGKAMQQLSESMKTDQLLAQADKQMKTAMPHLQSKLILDLIRGATYSASTLKRMFHEVEMPLQVEERILTVIGRIDEWKEGLTPYEEQLFLFALQNIAAEYLEKSVKQISVTYTDSNRIVWIIQPREAARQDGEWKRTVLFVQGTVEMIQHTCKQLLQTTLSFAIASRPHDWQELNLYYQSLALLFARGLGVGKEMILTQQDNNTSTPAQSLDLQLRNRMDKMHKFAVYLENGEKQHFFDELEELMKLASETTQDNLRLEAYYTLATMFLTCINRWDMFEDLSSKIDLGKLMSYDRHSTWEEIECYFAELAEQVFQQKWFGMYDQEHDVIKRMNWYVERNLSGDLSLSRIGDVLGHNPSYISRLYKQITGENLSDYISRMKLDKAKELLEDPQFKIHEVSKVVGFITEQSFYRFFKRATNLTPQEYRKRLTDRNNG